MSNPFQQSKAACLKSTVIDGGYCIGCGACAAVAGAVARMKLDDFGMFVAEMDNSAAIPPSVCPFGPGAPNEDVISAAVFDGMEGHSRIGRHLACYAGYVATGDYRARGSSGGIGKWLLVQLLERGMVDHVIQVSASVSEAGLPLYRYVVCDNTDEIRTGAKSAYHPIEMSGVLEIVRNKRARYAITGVPCFIKAVRLLQRHDPLYRERIRYTLGIVCGHLKSASYAKMLGWELGVNPGALEAIEFREKLPNLPANHKGIRATHRDGSKPTEVKSVRSLFGGDYNLGFFQYNACDFCDDVVGETADISIGDAWLPEYMGDPQGTSVIVVRNAEIAGLVSAAKEKGVLRLDEITADRVAESQAGGFRQRREGLAYRLHMVDKEGRWRPEKRVQPASNHLSKQRRRVYELRRLISLKSHKAFSAAVEMNDFSSFRDAMAPLISELNKASAPGFFLRVINGIKRRASNAFLSCKKN